MTIEQQVCTLNQAKRLKELGVSQCALLSHVFYIKGDDLNQTGFVTTEKFKSTDQTILRNLQWISAFNVAELGAMLPDWYYSVRNAMGEYGVSSTLDYHLIQVHKQDNTDEFLLNGCKNEAGARAYLLIHLLENNLMTIEEVNNRLTPHP